MELVNDSGIWKIVAPNAFNSYSVASRTFSTASTPTLIGRRPPRLANAKPFHHRSAPAPRLRYARRALGGLKAKLRCGNESIEDRNQCFNGFGV